MPKGQSPWELRWKSPTKVDRFDTVISAPRGSEGIEKHVRFNWKKNEWQALSDAGQFWQRISLDWLVCWCERCGYRGFIVMIRRGPKTFGRRFAVSHLAGDDFVP